MLFNSIEFAIFLPIVFIIYWFVTNKNVRLQNLFLFIVSYIFYGWWDWRFLLLLAFTSSIDYFVGIQIFEAYTKTRRKSFLLISIFLNLGMLGFFKYYNFFATSFSEAFTLFGKPFDPLRLNILLPVGISFYTFQSLSYAIDIYRRKLEPTKDFIAFMAFVSFFPQLVAGPINRAVHLLPQFYKKRNFDYTRAVDGMRQILWGLFKKVVIADNCAIHVNTIFNNYDNYSGSTLFLGALFFTFQIYCDFSGYSDIAIGTARLFGFDIMKNFAFPYFSRDIAEFWRRWHISLTTWFRDYVYIPLGGSKGGMWLKIRNTFIVFLISGFWHGANWTFIAWGALNAIYFLPLLLTNRNRNNLDTVAQGKFLPSFKDALNMLLTFGLTLIAWIFFRSANVESAFHYIAKIFSPSLFEMPWFESIRDSIYTSIIIVVFIVIEWLGRHHEYAIEKLAINWQTPLKWSFYYAIAMAIFLFGAKASPFIYFQF
jgi:D-alanyl-lipoteichoic acid acyltransferase DltB (MBOAT superfamily)